MAKSGGSFKPGQSGNPSGRPKVVAEVRDLARQYTPEAIHTLVSIMQDDDANPSARVAASNAILDRGYGKAQASLEITGNPVDEFTAFLRSLDDKPDKVAETDGKDDTIH